MHVTKIDDQYIQDLSRVAQIAPREDESLSGFAARVKVHRAYAESYADGSLDDGVPLDTADRAFHRARVAACDAIIAAACATVSCRR